MTFIYNYSLIKKCNKQKLHMSSSLSAKRFLIFSEDLLFHFNTAYSIHYSIQATPYNCKHQIIYSFIS